jgi:hypothetical protein
MKFKWTYLTDRDHGMGYGAISYLNGELESDTRTYWQRVFLGLYVQRKSWVGW